VAQLAVLHVSRLYRGQGAGRMLVDEVIGRARADHAKRTCISSAPTVRTVDFYRSLGFELERNPTADLVELEPEDIQLAMDL